MKNKFLQQDYGQKIDGTFIQYKGRIYFGRCDGGAIQLRDPATDKVVKVIAGTDEDLDLASIKLGFFNTVDNKGCMYVQRNPWRKVKQGVADVNISCHYLSTAGFQPIGSNSIHGKGVADGFNNSYPSIKSAENLFSNGWSSVALSHELAIVPYRDHLARVYFKKDDLGVYNFKSNVIDIPNSTFSQMYSKFVSEIPWVVK